MSTTNDQPSSAPNFKPEHLEALRSTYAGDGKDYMIGYLGQAVESMGSMIIDCADINKDHWTYRHIVTMIEDARSMHAAYAVFVTELNAPDKSSG